MKKVIIAGTFDVVHPGHLNLIKQATELGDFLVVIVARDENVLKTKGRKPYFNNEARVKNLQKLLSKINCKIVLGDLHDPYKIIKEERPQAVALGYDQQTHVKGLHDLVINSDLSFKIKRLDSFKENIFQGKRMKKAIADSSAGFLLINKPEDWTSHDAVARLRSITGIKKIGHAGTLDPMATGLLICAVGQATKLIGMLDVLPKTYEAVIRLGETSDSYDGTGKITKVRSSATEKVSTSDFQEVLKSFIGKQKQLPPMFSAKKIAGKKLYELARLGKEVERKPSEIEIYDIQLKNQEPNKKEPNKKEPNKKEPNKKEPDKKEPNKKSEEPNDFKIKNQKNQEPRIKNQEFSFVVKCSTGTYIRTLAHDIGEKLGTGALLQELKRTAIGDFAIKETVELSNLNSSNWQESVIKPLEAINHLNEFYGRNVFE